MPRPQVSVVKRQREQLKRERQQAKAERRAQRKNEKGTGPEISYEDAVRETPVAEDDAGA